MWRYPDRRQLLAAIGGAALVPRIAQARSDRPLRVMLLGQSLIQRDICRDGWPGMKAIATLLRGADVVFTDLETPIEGASAGEPTRADATLHHAPPTVLDCLKALSVTLVTTANNHAWDLGTGGILSTIDALDRRGIVHAGSGRDLTVAAAPAIQHTPRGGFALVAAAAGAIRPGAAAATDHPGVNELRRRDDGTLEPADVARVLAAIRAARAAGATVLMCLHNHYWEPVQSDTPGWQKAFARACVDAGAAAFVGHGTPVMQAHESYRGAPLFHGLGNFIFQTRKADGAYGAAAWQSMIVEARFAGGRFAGARVHPIRLDATRSGDFSRGVPEIVTTGGA